MVWLRLPLLEYRGVSERRGHPHRVHYINHVVIIAIAGDLADVHRVDGTVLCYNDVDWEGAVNAVVITYALAQVHVSDADSRWYDGFVSGLSMMMLL